MFVPPDVLKVRLHGTLHTGEIRGSEGLWWGLRMDNGYVRFEWYTVTFADDGSELNGVSSWWRADYLGGPLVCTGTSTLVGSR